MGFLSLTYVNVGSFDKGEKIMGEHSFCIFFFCNKTRQASSTHVVGHRCREHAQFRWKPFSMVAARRRSRMISSEEYSGNFR